MEEEIFINHKDWNGYCIIKNNKIIRKDYLDEEGIFIKNKNKLTIQWLKWNEEDFYYYDNDKYYYDKNLFEEYFLILNIFDKENIINLILNKSNNKFIIHKKKLKIDGTYSKENGTIYLEYNDKILNKSIYKNITHNIYCLIDEYYNSIYYELKISNNSIDENYIFNKITKKFYNVLNIDNSGKYESIDNSLIMKWNNGNEKKFYSNKYISYDKINKNIHVIKPINIIIEDRVLFSNISLCKNKIILSSMHYKYNNWEFDYLDLSITNINIINKIIYDNDDEYEGSTTIILELDQIVNNLFLKINYKKNYNFNIYLEQLNIIENTLSAMTLFKDDYQLLKSYLKYYNNLGINIFFLYYNKKIDYSLIEEIIKFNENNSIIYLIEWDYIYWYKDLNNPKYHHAQMMAVNDSLHILKNYSKYTLYNDLDEYIDNNFKNFESLIETNKDIDIFIFKNRFCKMGDKLINFLELDEYFCIENIIQGNYYHEFREKNLIKLENINVMGVHKIFKKYSKKELNEIIVSQFFHFVNFQEKSRLNLMTEYIY